MSHSVEWIEPVMNRTYIDVLNIENNPEDSDAKGSLNYTDLNRIESNTKYVAEDMLERKIIRTPPTMAIKTNWTSNDIPTKNDVERIIGNVNLLMSLSNPVITSDFRTIYNSTQWSYTFVNAIEYNLKLMKDQPELPVQKWLLRLTNGIISEANSSEMLVEENRTVTIIGVVPSVNPYSMTFDHWTGPASELQNIADVNSQTTTYQMQYHESQSYVVELTADFNSNILRTVTLTNAVINDGTESTTKQFYAGEQVPILANVAPQDKRFYQWSGTQSALNNMNNISASTTYFTMPDNDVSLQPTYIYPGKHTLTVDGTTIGSYDYGETIPISVDDTSAKYDFDYWTGDTSYVNDINSNPTVVTMPDRNVTIYSSWKYVYSYNTVNIVNGKARIESGTDGQGQVIYSYVNKVENAKEQSLLTIIADDASDFVRWSVDGGTQRSSAGDFANSTATWNPGNNTDNPALYRVRDGDSTVTALKNNVAVVNKDNEGTTTKAYIAVGSSYSQNTATDLTYYRFERWEKNGALLTTNYGFSDTITDGMNTYTAVYSARDPSEIHTLTVINNNNSGETETSEVAEGNNYYIGTQSSIGYYTFSYWNKNGSYFSSNAVLGWIQMASEDVTYEAVYTEAPKYTLTVNNGLGSGSYHYNEYVNITANAPSEGFAFDHWQVDNSSDNIYIANKYSSSTRVRMRNHASSITAVYVKAYTITLTYLWKYDDGTYETVTDTYIKKSGETISRTTAEKDDYDFINWTDQDDNVISTNRALYFTVGNENKTITANYAPKPYYTITLLNGTINRSGSYYGASTGTFMRDTRVEIKMNSAPEGMQFSKWEVLSGTGTLANENSENTTFLLKDDSLIKGTYQTPQGDTYYTLSIINSAGNVTTTNHLVGEQISITADSPEQGYEFYKWIGDNQYIADKYASNTTLTMPEDDIVIEMKYQVEGTVILYHVLLNWGQLLLPNGTWDIQGEFPERAVVQIKAVDIPSGYRFKEWTDSDNGKSTSTVTRTDAAETTITVEDFDITLIRDVELIPTYIMTIINGEVSGTYYENDQVAVYFNMENTETVHYVFTNWSGDTSYLELYGGGTFDVTVAGTANSPQVIKMPARDITITANYNTTYKLSLINGNIGGQSSGFYAENDIITITANTITGQTFTHWSGDTQYIDNVNNPTATVTMPNSSISLTANYE